jgi:phosphoglycolate phosphatase
MADPVLVLWDIDHTLIETRGVGAELFREAFEQATGRTLEHSPDVTGRTERAIFAETARAHGVEPGPLQDEYEQLLAAGYRDHAAELAQRGRAIPGAAEAISALAGAGGIIQSVLTGNLRTVAEIKLRVFGLAGSLDLDIAACGSDDPVRARLVGIARQRAAAKYRSAFGPYSTVLIGDTPSDIGAARDGGAGVVAVATGRSTAAQLRQAGAGVVLQDLSDPAAVLAGVMSLAVPPGTRA